MEEGLGPDETYISKSVYDTAMKTRGESCKDHGGDWRSNPSGNWNCKECLKEGKVLSFNDEDKIVVEPAVPDSTHSDEVGDEENRSPDLTSGDEAVELATKEAAELATKEAAELATKEAAELATKEAAELATKEKKQKEDNEAAAIAEKLLKKQKRSERKRLRFKRLQTYKERKAVQSKTTQTEMKSSASDPHAIVSNASSTDIEEDVLPVSEEGPNKNIVSLKKEREEIQKKIDALFEQKKELKQRLQDMPYETLSTRQEKRDYIKLENEKDDLTLNIRDEYAKVAKINRKIGKEKTIKRFISQQKRKETLKILEDESDKEKAEAAAAEAAAAEAAEAAAAARAARVVSPITEVDKHLALEDDSDALDEKELDNLKKAIEIPELADRKKLRKDLVFEKARLKLKLDKMDVSNALHEPIKERIFNITDALNKMKTKGGKRTRRGIKKSKKQRERSHKSTRRR